MSKIYVGQEVTLRVKTFQDTTSATSRELKIKKKDGTILTFAATQTAGSTDTIEYTTNSTDLDLVGMYLVQAVVAFGGGKQRGETHALIVHAEFD